MKVLSTNIGKPQLIEWRGQQIETGIYKYPVNEPIFLGSEDVVADHVIDRRYHGGVDKACYLYSADHYSFWKNKYPEVDFNWGMFGENITMSGLNESQINIGDSFQLGEAVVQVSQPRQPCFKLGVRFNDQKVVSDFWELPYPGIYLRIIKQGNVKNGDEMILLDRNIESLTVSRVFSIFSGNRENMELIDKALKEDFLAASCRRDIDKIRTANL